MTPLKTTKPVRGIAEDCLAVLDANPEYNMMYRGQAGPARNKVEKLFTSANSKLDLKDGRDYLPSHTLHLDGNY